MASFFDTINNTANNLSNSANQIVSGSNFEADGFVVSNSSGADGNQLPSSNVSVLRPNAKEVRRVVNWFVPEYGVVKMYVNPQSIQYTFKKIINKTQTKGGFVIQYWGEDLSTLNITGTTGSSGVEGINVLYEIYRAEQLAFDAVGLSLSANASAANNLSDSIGNAIGGNAGALIGGAIGSALNTNPGLTDILPQNIPTLASMALGVEMFWNGWVFRGYFNDFSFNESAERIGSFNYTMNFVVTQRRGYRVNALPWQHSATLGPSNNGWGGIPNSFAGGKYGFVNDQVFSESIGNNNIFTPAQQTIVGNVFTPGSRNKI